MKRAKRESQETTTNAADAHRGPYRYAPRARHVLLALTMFAAGACGAAPGTTDAPHTSLPPSAAVPVDFEAMAAKALSAVTYPAAAVVLSVRERKVLGVAEVNSGDAANTALRPGSTMKPLLAYAAIERGIALGSVACDGSYHGLTCIARHGELDLEHAIAASCNVYFYDVAHTLGPAQSMAALRSFGFGAPTTLLSREASGFVPAWTGQEEDLDLRNMATATGHGQLRVTLLQLAAAYATLATRLTEAAARTDARSLALAKITSGLRDVVEDEQGKGHGAAVEGFAVAGKTGAGEPDTDIGPAMPSPPDNKWFVAYAPLSAPEVVIAVEITGPGAGSTTPASVAGEILRGWLATVGDRRRHTERPIRSEE